MVPWSSSAQPSVPARAYVPRLDDAAYVAFSRRDGVPEEPIFSVNMTRSGELWLGSISGPRRFTGSSWHLVPLPTDVEDPATRDVLEGTKGERYFVLNRGVAIARNGRTVATNVPLDSLAGPIYSAALQRSPGGGEALVVGARGGVFRLRDGDRWEQVSLPEELRGWAAMVATRSVGDTDELWVGALGGGVARLRNGSWRVWGRAHGLEDLEVEQVVLTTAGDSLEALIATATGVYALTGDRWQRLGSPLRAVRILRVRIRDAWETWVGTLVGQVWRARDGQPWQSVEISARGRGSRVQILEAVDHGLAESTIYVGFRSGALLRYRVGVAGRLVTPAEHLGHPVIASALRPGTERYWGWMIGHGLLRLPEFEAIPSTQAMFDASDHSVVLLPDSTVRGAELLAALERGLFRLQDGQWREILKTGPGEVVRALLHAPTSGKSWAPLVVTTYRAYVEQPSGALTPWRDFPVDSRVVVADSVEGAPALLVVTRLGEVRRFAGGRWDVINGGASPLTEPAGSGVMWRYPSGERALILGTADGIALLRTAGGPSAWKVANHRTHVGFRADDVNRLRVIPDGRLAVGTAHGLVVLQPGSSFDDTLRTVASFTEADGLPHAGIRSIGSVDSAERLWVGTDLGAGFIYLASIDADAGRTGTLALQVHDGQGGVLADGAPIAADAGRLDVELQLATYHREDENRFRLELDGTPVTADEWTDRRSLSLLSLSPGRHTLRAWGVDWMGNQAGPLTRELVVLTPWWRSPLAVILYTLLLAGGVILIDRARVGGARRRALEAEGNERRLATSEIRFRRLFEDGTNAQLLVLDGRIWQANATAVSLLHSSETSGLVDRDVEDVLPGIGAALAESTASAARAELVAHTTGGESIPVDVRRTRIPLDGAAIDHLELRDLRERKRLEEDRQRLELQLRESQRLESLGTLAGGVAHDFNNLLTVIHANAELAALDVDPVSEAGQSLQQLLTASRRARDVVRQILTFSRRAPSRRELVPVHALLGELQSLLRSTIPSTVQLVIEDAAPGASIAGDATQLQQMLLNLCTNAEYAMRASDGGVLSVHVSWVRPPQAFPGGRLLSLRVRDTGSGMTPEVRSRIFEPFFTTKPVGEGTGLGLSVLHGIVGSLSGSVTVDSMPGGGTTVEVILPAVVDHRDADHANATSERGAAPTIGNRILLVDDESAVADVLARLLVREGFVVDVLHDGRLALDRMRHGPPFDLLLTDQTMPRMTGLQLAEQLRAMGVSIPVIIASGFGSTLDDKRMAALGHVWRLDKPFGVAQLLRTVQLAMNGASRAAPPQESLAP